MKTLQAVCCALLCDHHELGKRMETTKKVRSHRKKTTCTIRDHSISQPFGTVLPSLSFDVAHNVNQVRETGAALFFPDAPAPMPPDPDSEDFGLVTRDATPGPILPPWAFL